MAPTERKISNNSSSSSKMSFLSVGGSHGVRKLPLHRSRMTTTSTVIGSLPKDLLVDVLARVASDSFTDLFNARLSCQDFLESTGDNYIYQHISIDKFPVTHWFPPSERVLSFLTRCFDNKNPESLFRQGMVDYFKECNVESGLKYLEMATNKGHPEATYVYGMILLSGGEKSSQEQGLNLLKLKNFKVQDSRDKVQFILSQMWVNNTISPQEVDTKCHDHDHAIRAEKWGWSLDEDVEIPKCGTCFWYRELFHFCKIMNV